jgi:hypothetical protein
MLFKILNIIKKSKTIFYLSEFIISFFIVTIYHFFAVFITVLFLLLTFGYFPPEKFDIFFITIIPLFFLSMYLWKLILKNDFIRIFYFSIIILYHIILPIHRFYNRDISHNYKEKSLLCNTQYYFEEYYGQLFK